MRWSILTAAALLAACAQTAAPGMRMRIVAPPSEADAAAMIAEIRRDIGTVPVDRFESRSFTADNGIVLPYRLLKPADGGKLPLVVLFHGSGAIGNDNQAQVDLIAKSWASDDIRRRYPAFILAPQFTSRLVSYVDHKPVPTPQLAAALGLVDAICRELPVDERRLYLVGFSMGAGGVWSALAQRPGRFAAAAALAGVPDPAAIPLLGGTHVLVIHGDRDGSFDTMMAVLKANPSPNVELWQYLGIGHELGPQLLAGAELPAWLFRWRLGVRAMP